MVAIFGQPIVQGLQLLTQAVHPLIVVLEQGLLLRHLEQLQNKPAKIRCTLIPVKYI